MDETKRKDRIMRQLTEEFGSLAEEDPRDIADRAGL